MFVIEAKLSETSIDMLLEQDCIKRKLKSGSPSNVECFINLNLTIIINYRNGALLIFKNWRTKILIYLD